MKYLLMILCLTNTAKADWCQIATKGDTTQYVQVLKWNGEFNKYLCDYTFNGDIESTLNVCIQAVSANGAKAYCNIQDVQPKKEVQYKERPHSLYEPGKI